MSFALKELSSLLAKKVSNVGVVVSLDKNSVRIATTEGVRLAKANGNLNVGERVVLSDGIATRAPTPKVVVSV